MTLTKLELLYDEALENDIEIVNARFSKTKKAACICGDDYKAIVLDKPRIKPEEELIILAEEIGHYETGGIYNLEEMYNDERLIKLHREKSEAKARHWAIKKVISPKTLQKAIDETCCYEYSDYYIAEYCEVPVEYIQEAFRLYQSQGIKFKFPDWDS